MRSQLRSALLGGVAALAGVGVGDVSLLASATAYLNGIAPYHWFDFINDRCLYASNDVGGVSGATGYSFARASVGTYRNADGTTTQFSSGQLRRGNRGVLIEGARTNFFLNSATGATQNITVAALTFTLSFEGTGTITLSGASTAGPLVGTGALNRVSLTFVPSAGTLTLTISGAVERVNFEVGAFASSWIPTAGSSVTRAADVLTCTAGVSYPLSLWAEFERAVDTGVQDGILAVTLNTSNATAMTVRADDKISYQVLATTGGFVQSDVVALGVFKTAGRTELNNVRAANNGTLTSTDTSVSVPSDPATLLFGGYSGVGHNPLFGYIRRAAIFNSALSNANLQSVTT